MIPMDSKTTSIKCSLPNQHLSTDSTTPEDLPSWLCNPKSGSHVTNHVRKQRTLLESLSNCVCSIPGSAWALFAFSVFTSISMIIGILTVYLTATKEPSEPCEFVFASMIQSSVDPTILRLPIAVGDFNNDKHLDIVIANPNNNNLDILLGFGNGTFPRQATLTVASNSRPSWIAAGDFNNDNQLDIIVANFNNNNVGVFLAYGNGTFTSEAKFSTGASRPLMIAINDFNNDAKLDILVANYGTNNVGVLLGYGNGNFSNQMTFSTGYDSFPYSLAIGDFNRDQYMDAVVANHGTNNVGVLLGYGDGTFAKQITYSTGVGSAPKSVVVVDLNNDNQLDIVVANFGHGNVGVLLGYGNGSFGCQKIYSTGTDSRPYSVATGDFNNDNRTDIVVANSGTNNVGVLLGYGDGNFRSKKTYSIDSNSSPQIVAVGNFNDDNWMDVVVTIDSPNNIGVLVGDGSKSFVLQAPYSSGLNTRPFAVAIGDFNNDTLLDFVIANYAANNLHVLLGYGNGSFRRLNKYDTGNNSHPYAVAIGDFNNDQRLDIVVANGDANNVGILLGYGNGTFRNQITYPTGSNSLPSSVAVGDFNKDTSLDIAVANYGTSNIGIFLGYGNGTFASQTTYSTGNGSSSRSVAIGDFNNDTHLDIVVANRDTNNIGILLGYGNGIFASQFTYSTGNGSSPRSITIADFNNDTFLDIAVANYDASNVCIFLGNGNGSFKNRMTYSPDSKWFPYSIASGDFNNDNRIDITVADLVNGEVGVLLGYANGSFAPLATFKTGSRSAPSSITTGDFNNDNQLDIVVTNNLYHNTLILLGSYNSPFTSLNIYSTGSVSSPFAIAVGDFNHDTRLDIVVANCDSDNVGVLLGYGNATFQNQTTYFTGYGSSPYSVTVRDINNDNQLDIIVANCDGDNVGVLLGHSNGTFGSQTIYSTGLNSRPHSVVVNDLNNDNQLDIVVANYGSNEIAVLLNYGPGAFTSQTIFPVGSGALPTSIGVEDFNNDTHLDIVIANGADENVGILLGNGDGTFRNQTIYLTGPDSAPRSVAVGDFNNDKKSDIAVANNDSVGVFLGIGDGTFANQTMYSTGSGSRPWSITVGDFNDDTQLDIAVVHGYSNEMGVLLGHGDGTFANQTTYSTGLKSSPRFIVVGDFNSDSRLDIAVANAGTNNIGIFLGYGNGTFTSQTTYSTEPGSVPRSIGIGDFNSDNQVDIAVANFGTQKIGVFLGYGNGTFVNQATYFTGSSTRPGSVVVSDFNQDDDLDIAVANVNGNSVGIFLGNGDGTFVRQITYSTGSASYPSSIVVGDFNNDNWLDIGVTNPYTDNVGVFLGDEKRFFFVQTTYSTGSNSRTRSVNIGDFNNDQAFDIVVANSGNDNIGLFLGYGNGTFANQTTYSTGSSSHPSSVAIGDFNNDTRLDIVAANRDSNNIVVFLGYGDGTFATPMMFSSDSVFGPLSVDIIDLNNDRILDIVVVNNGTDNVGIFLGRGNGNFTFEKKYSTGYNSRPCSVVVGDFNNDRWADIALTTYHTKKVEILVKKC